MVDSLRVLPHFRQSDKKRNCGAACMAMLFKHYGMHGKMSDITDKISQTLPSGSLSCRNYLMIQYALQKGLNCSVVSAKDPRTFIPFCLESGIELFISYHANLPEDAGHFVLVSSASPDGVFFNDPQQNPPAGINVYMPYDDLLTRMKYLGPDDEITRDNVMVLFAKQSAPVSVLTVKTNGHEFPIFENTLDKIHAFVDPYVNDWLSVEASPSTSTVGIVV